MTAEAPAIIPNVHPESSRIIVSQFNRLWARLRTAGKASPSGPNSSLQFNSGGELGGDQNLVWDAGNRVLQVGDLSKTEANGRLALTVGGAAQIGAPVSSHYQVQGAWTPGSVNKAARWPVYRNSGEQQQVLDVSPITSLKGYWFGGDSTNPLSFAAAFAMPYSSSAFSVSTPSVALATNKKNAAYKSRITTAGVAAGELAFIRSTAQRVIRGSSGFGGYQLVAHFGFATLRAGNRFFAGIQTSNADPTNIDPLTDTTSKLGVGFNANTGNLFFIHSSSSAVSISDSLIPISTSKLYRLVINCLPSSAFVDMILQDLDGGNNTEYRVTGANQPPANSACIVTQWMTNNATIGTISWDFVSTILSSPIGG